MKIRVKRIPISPDALMHVMENDTAWRVKKGLPKDSKIKGVTLDPYANVINLFIEHESFDLIEIGSVAPVLETEFHKIK